jgi:hypothetical protein
LKVCFVSLFFVEVYKNHPDFACQDFFLAPSDNEKETTASALFWYIHDNQHNIRQRVGHKAGRGQETYEILKGNLW